jgi:hypothetical protein
MAIVFQYGVLAAIKKYTLLLGVGLVCGYVLKHYHDEQKHKWDMERIKASFHSQTSSNLQNLDLENLLQKSSQDDVYLQKQSKNSILNSRSFLHSKEQLSNSHNNCARQTYEIPLEILVK